MSVNSHGRARRYSTGHHSVGPRGNLMPERISGSQSTGPRPYIERQSSLTHPTATSPYPRELRSSTSAPSTSPPDRASYSYRSPTTYAVDPQISPVSPAVISRSPPTDAPVTRHGSPRNGADEVNILLLGQTGAGKSSFINRLRQPGDGSRRQAEIGHSLVSCTAEVNEYSCIGHGCNLNLIDTPGFDDTNRSDMEILTVIAQYLARHLHSGRRIHGVLFLHRIVDVRLSASVIKMAELAKRICGERFYDHVTLVSTMWELLPDTSVGYERARELLNHPRFWADFHREGAPHVRYSNTRETARKIITEVIKSARVPAPLLRIQSQLWRGLSVPETDAGEFLEGELKRRREKHEQDLQRLREDIQRVTHDSDPAIAELLSCSYDSKRSQMQQIERELQNIGRRQDGISTGRSISTSATSRSLPSSNVDAPGFWTSRDLDYRPSYTSEGETKIERDSMSARYSDQLPPSQVTQAPLSGRPDIYEKNPMLVRETKTGAAKFNRGIKHTSRPPGKQRDPLTNAISQWYSRGR